MRIAASIKRAIKKLLPDASLNLTWTKRTQGSWLAANLPVGQFQPPRLSEQPQIEETATRINARGAQPLWNGYRGAYDRDDTVPWANQPMERLPDQVRTQPQIGRLLSYLAEKRKPSVIVEVGTAFGISARYWIAGLQRAGSGAGRLITFDPNEVWHQIAAEHLSSFGNYVEIVLGTFEDNVDRQLNGEKIQLAFVDAIHTDEFVSRQVEMIVERMADNCLIVVDDIGFSSDMQICWARLARDPRAVSSVSIDNRIGILEFTAVRP